MASAGKVYAVAGDGGNLPGVNLGRVGAGNDGSGILHGSGSLRECPDLGSGSESTWKRGAVTKNDPRLPGGRGGERY